VLIDDDITYRLRVTISEGTITTFQKLIDESVYYLGQAIGALPQYAISPKWYMHNTIWAGYMSVRSTTKSPIWNFALDPNGKPVLQLMGYPVEITQVAPKLSQTAVSTVMALLADLMTGAGFARSTQGIAIDTSTDVKFAEDQTAFRGIDRVDIGVIDSACISQIKTAAS